MKCVDVLNRALELQQLSHLTYPTLCQLMIITLFCICLRVNLQSETYCKLKITKSPSRTLKEDHRDSWTAKYFWENNCDQRIAFRQQSIGKQTCSIVIEFVHIILQEADVDQHLRVVSKRINCLSPKWLGVWIPNLPASLISGSNWLSPRSLPYQTCWNLMWYHATPSC